MLQKCVTGVMNENKAHQAKDSQVGEKQKILISENSTMTDTRTHTRTDNTGYIHKAGLDSQP